MKINQNIKNIIPFNIEELTTESAWLLGFIYADSTIGDHLKQRVIRLYNTDKELLENIKEHFQIPYKVCKQVNKTTTVYFIRFCDPKFVESIERLGLSQDRSNLKIPKMTDECTKSFIRGFLKGKGSTYTEISGSYSFKAIYRSHSFINEISKSLSKYCDVKIHNAHCRFIKNHLSCGIKYIGKECDKIKDFISSEIHPWEKNYTI